MKKNSKEYTQLESEVCRYLDSQDGFTRAQTDCVRQQFVY